MKTLAALLVVVLGSLLGACDDETTETGDSSPCTPGTIGCASGSGSSSSNSSGSGSSTTTTTCATGNKLCPALGSTPAGCYSTSTDCSTITTCGSRQFGCPAGYSIDCARGVCVKNSTGGSSSGNSSSTSVGVCATSTLDAVNHTTAFTCCQGVTQATCNAKPNFQYFQAGASIAVCKTVLTGATCDSSCCYK